MKKLSLIIASALLLGGISFASPLVKKQDKKATTAKQAAKPATAKPAAKPAATKPASKPAVKPAAKPVNHTKKNGPV